MDKDQKQRWKETRKQGIKVYVLKCGGLVGMIGIPIASFFLTFEI